jgi:DNA-binding NarL/FixJ family response regulator
VSLRADHARHLAARDANALMQTVDELEEIGVRLYACEAAAQAASLFVDAGRHDSARRAAARSRELFADGQGAARPTIDGLDGAAIQLTPRESELVALARQGLTNQQIAERLVLSVRTVETFLYRAMRKLGVNDRRQL